MFDLMQKQKIEFILSTSRTTFCKSISGLQILHLSNRNINHVQQLLNIFSRFRKISVKIFYETNINLQILLYEIETMTPERTILSLKMKKLFAFNVKYIFVEHTFKYKISPRKSQRKAYTCTNETLRLCSFINSCLQQRTIKCKQ